MGTVDKSIMAACNVSCMEDFPMKVSPLDASVSESIKGDVEPLYDTSIQAADRDDRAGYILTSTNYSGSHRSLTNSTWNISLYSFHEFIDLTRSSSRLHALVVSRTQDFEILSINCSDIPEDLRDLEDNKVIKLNESYFSNEILMKTPEGSLSSSRSSGEEMGSMEDLLGIQGECGGRGKGIKKARNFLGRRWSRLEKKVVTGIGKILGS